MNTALIIIVITGCVILVLTTVFINSEKLIKLKIKELELQLELTRTQDSAMQNMDKRFAENHARTVSFLDHLIKMRELANAERPEAKE